jgi:CrcB protein
VLLWVGVALLGGAGSVARFLLDGLASATLARSFPLGTLLVNLSGSVLLGLLSGLALGADAYLLAGTATIGSYTTFSTWALESQRLAEEGARWPAVVNVVGSLVAGVAAAALGRAIA